MKHHTISEIEHWSTFVRCTCGWRSWYDDPAIATRKAAEHRSGTLQGT